MYDTKPIKPKRVKLRGKHIIEIDPQILRWRKFKKKLEMSTQSCQNTPHNEPGCLITNERVIETATPATPIWDLFK